MSMLLFFFLLLRLPRSTTRTYSRSPYTTLFRSVYGAADLPLHSYAIPILILAPGHLLPGRSDTLISQLDIAPTVMGLLGLPYQAPFLDRKSTRLNSSP